MTPASLKIIRHEHRALSAMLRAIILLLDKQQRRGMLPDFHALQAMLFYVDEFPEKLHHPKESGLLFPKLRGRDAHIDAVLDRLDLEHALGEQSIRDVQHALLGFQVMSGSSQQEARRDTFTRAMTHYVSSYIEHMMLEETEVLPFAQAVLHPEDWAELDAAFLMNRDPLAGYEADEIYLPLFTRILGTLETSGGIDSALEALAGATRPKFAPHR